MWAESFVNNHLPSIICHIVNNSNKCKLFYCNPHTFCEQWTYGTYGAGSKITYTFTSDQQISQLNATLKLFCPWYDVVHVVKISIKLFCYGKEEIHVFRGWLVIYFNCLIVILERCVLWNRFVQHTS